MRRFGYLGLEFCLGDFNCLIRYRVRMRLIAIIPLQSTSCKPPIHITTHDRRLYRQSEHQLFAALLYKKIAVVNVRCRLDANAPASLAFKPGFKTYHQWIVLF